MQTTLKIKIPFSDSCFSEVRKFYAKQNDEKGKNKAEYQDNRIRGYKAYITQLKKQIKK